MNMAGTFFEGRSFLHRLHPSTKFIVLGLVCVAVFLFEGWTAPIVLTSFLMVLYFASGLGAARLYAVLRTLPVFVAIIVLARMFLVERELPLGTRAIAGALQALRVVGLVLAVHLFVSLTDPVSMSDAVGASLRPLRRAGVRVGEASLMILIASSFIPFMISEVRRLQLAQASRSGFPKRGIGAVRAAVPLVAPLVIGVLRRTDELELALAARCFRLDVPRRPSGAARPRAVDYVASIAAAVIFAGALWARGLSR
jgi:energy-coupling factor transporter transmembrane protein EcfT